MSLPLTCLLVLCMITNFLLCVCVDELVTGQPLFKRHFVTSELTEDSRRIKADSGNTTDSSRQSLKKLLPFSVSGNCKRGLIYEITSTEQLETYVDEFHCIFALGGVPKTIPLGLWEGQILSAANTELANAIGELGWGGKLSSKSQCRDSGTEFYFIQNLVFGSLVLPALTYIGHIQDKVGEASGIPDGLPSLFCDYTVHWEDVCPVEANQKHAVYLGVLNSLPFGNANYDMLRVVGKSTDGGWIMLGRSMYRDVNNASNGVMTAAWWYVTAYDSVAFEEVPVKLGPLQNEFTFHHGGLPAILERFNPFDNAPSDFKGTLESIAYYNFFMPLGIPPTGSVKTNYEKATLAGVPWIPKYNIKPGNNTTDFYWGLQGRIYPKQ